MLHSIAFPRKEKKKSRMTKQVFFFLLLLLYIVVPTNAFRQSLFRRQHTYRNSCLHTRLFLTTHHATVQRCFATTNSRRQTLLSPRHLHGWRTRRYSSSTTDQQDSEVDNNNRVDNNIADEAADEDEDATFHDKSEIDNFFDEAERDANRMNFPKGQPEGYYVTKQYSVPEKGFENLVTTNTGGSSSSNSSSEGQAVGITQEEVDRLGISGTNITLPIALMLLDGEMYPSLSRARKACR